MPRKCHRPALRVPRAVPSRRAKGSSHEAGCRVTAPREPRDELREARAKRAAYMRQWRKANPGKHYGYWKASRLRDREMRSRQRGKNYEKGAAHLTLAERAQKRPWTDREDTLVLAHATPDRQLAAQIRRSVRAIQIRRARLAHPEQEAE